MRNEQAKTYYTYFPDGQIDHCGVTFHYQPATFPDMSKWNLDFTVDEAETVELRVSYDRKNITGLLKDHLRMFMKLTLVDATNGVLDETEWIDIRLFGQSYRGEELFDKEDYVLLYFTKQLYAFQFGVAYDDVQYHIGTDVIPEPKQLFINSTDIAFLSDVKYTGFDFSDFEIPKKSFPPLVRYYSPLTILVFILQFLETVKLLLMIHKQHILFTHLLLVDFLKSV